MHRNYWTKQIFVKKLNAILAIQVSHHVGCVWTEDLKKEISKIALKFMKDNDLDDIAFAVQLEKGQGSGNIVEKFKGIRIFI